MASLKNLHWGLIILSDNVWFWRVLLIFLLKWDCSHSAKSYTRGIIDRLEINQDFESSSSLCEDWDQVTILNCSRDVSVYVDKSGDTAKKVLEESHDHWCEIGEQCNFVTCEDIEILKDIKTYHQCICHVRDRPRCVIQVVIKVSIVISPFHQRQLIEPDIQSSIVTRGWIRGIIISCGSS